MNETQQKELDFFLEKSTYHSVVVTLYEGHYHYGVASLLNSLINFKFEGLLRVGVKGGLPPWVNQLKKQSENIYEVNTGFLLSFEEIDPGMHFGYYKPVFLKDTLQKFKNAEKVYYFDPDIVVIAPWEFYSDWADCGVALCLDNCFPYVNRNHPWRVKWKSLGNGGAGMENNVDYYVNSGFIGLHRQDAEILDRWIRNTQTYKAQGGDLSRFEKEGHRAFKGDQDILNATITLSGDIRFSIIGTEGMGFNFPAYLMAHSIGDTKPWKENFCKLLFRNGIKPSIAVKEYFKYCNSPVSPFGRLQYLGKKIDLKTAILFGRVFG